MTNTTLVQWFRQSTPYVNLHSGKVFVIMLDSEVSDSSEMVNIINDISLLHSLNIRIVIVFGAKQQIDKALNTHHISSQYYQNIRITEAESLPLIQQAVGALHYDLCAKLSLRLPHSSVIHVVSGNMVLGQPLGVIDGIDYGFSGKVRRIDIDAIKQYLEQHSLVLIGPLAPSVTGEIFSLPFEEIAEHLAIQLNADKLIGFCRDQGICDEQGCVISDLSPDDAQTVLEEYIARGEYHSPTARFLQVAVKVCREGINRAHLISYKENGALLQEIFSRDGVGTQISLQHSEKLRIATERDIPGLLELTRPLEQQGILVKRSRKQLEIDISCYTIIEKDNIVIACAALHLYENEAMAEMACVVVHPDYRDSSRGDLLLENIEKQAKLRGIKKLFVLTTKTTQWFQERGFVLSDVDKLPKEKRQQYNYQRNSRVLMKSLH